MFKKLKIPKKSDYNWIGKYIRDYNEMIAYYEGVIKEKDSIIDELQKELRATKPHSNLKPRVKQISDMDIEKIKRLKEEGHSYSYIAKATGWSKATISRVINNKQAKA